MKSTDPNFCLCRICSFEFDEHRGFPILLNCGHSLCKSCCMEIIMANQRCPFCRRIIKAIAKNFLALEYKDVIKQNIKFTQDYYSFSASMREKLQNCKEFLKSKVTLEAFKASIHKQIREIGKDINKFCLKTDQYYTENNILPIGCEEINSENYDADVSSNEKCVFNKVILKHFYNIFIYFFLKFN